MSIQKNCVRGQYFGFLRDYYQKYSSIDLHFPNENQSFDAFQKLREIGVRCFHAGKNAPCGASVMMYSYGNDSLQLQIK